MMRWDEKLTKEERRHLREEAGVTSLAAFKRVHAYHQKWRRERPLCEPCYICKGIAQKLGLLAEDSP